MEKDLQRANNNGISTNSNGRAADGGLLLRSTSETTRQTTTATAATTSDFVLQWGSRKRPRCMKVQVKDDGAAHKAAAGGRVERRVIRVADKDSANPTANNHGNGTVYLNLRQRPSSPPFPPLQRVLRNSENSSAMRGHSNGGLRGFSSPDRGAHDKKGTNHPHPLHSNHHHHLISNSHHHHHHNESNNKSAASSETAHDSKKGGSSSGSGDAAVAPPPVWPPKFVIALTNKEKEEDFIIFKGSKLPQRPKKRAKMVQRTVNLVSPGAWLCDLTLERYEVREKKISKKRPRGLKAMGNMDSDSE
ncbi:probable serine/threonine-protein kinase DDB_G0282963 [Rhodamnia argentea]|uniref:Probable serine/threonine-protein kinase DDB_G0282963 n=1 Tax=Rhodamnia argentea TaxID=178133 RepID=A0A8B8QZ98_9MYRT|nr:probable serine/threonine-protein kinase DDB_G0282963 [Rhodamnia argentea]XP_030552526.2 probable serine/threonine-protein kinase DDB_G0282963 [Rhodamnia argentea]XP_048132968.1 probable serine/threonine-protein kinase DDB_G0282963 [Rhodamnia argentea]